MMYLRRALFFFIFGLIAVSGAISQSENDMLTLFNIHYLITNSSQSQPIQKELHFQHDRIVNNQVTLFRDDFEAERKSQWIFVLFGLIFFLIMVVFTLLLQAQRRKINHSRNEQEELKMFNEKVQAEKDKLYGIFESTETGIWELNLETMEMNLSPMSRIILGFGYKMSRISVYMLKDILSADDQKSLDFVLQKVIHGGLTSLNFEFKIETAGKRYAWIQGRASVISHSESNLPLMVAGTFSDNTGIMVLRDEASHANKKRLLSENRYLGLFTSSMDGIIRIDSEGVILEANDAFLNMIGYLEEEVVYHSWLEFTQDFFRIREVSQNDTMNSLWNFEEEFEKVFVHKDGSSITVSMRMMRMDKDGFPGTSWSIIRNITEQKRSHQELIDKEEYLQSILNTTSSGFLVFDSDSRIINVNSAICEMTGYSLHELKQLSLNDIDVIDTPEDIKRKMELLKISGRATFETRFRKKDWQELDIQVSSTWNDSYRHFVAFCMDISSRNMEQRRLSEAVEQLERLNLYINEALENERTTLAREIHDVLGQSMTALKIDMGWLIENLTNLNLSSPKIEGMRKLVNEIILNVQQISGELRPGILEDLGLASAIEWYCDDYRKRTGILCRLLLSDEYIQNEELQLALYRVFQESLTNIARHASASEITVKLGCTSQYLLMEISDNGVGIDKGKLKSKMSFGLIGMNERINYFGGTVQIGERLPNGTIVKVFVPIKGGKQ
jgi:PAS domain S-box-containing protein